MKKEKSHYMTIFTQTLPIPKIKSYFCSKYVPMY